MLILDLQAARGLLDILALLLLATSLGLTSVRRLDSAIRLLAGQGLLLACAAAVVALASGSGHAYLAVLITVAIKVLAVPGILLSALREVRIKREIELVVTPRQLLLLAIGLVLVAYYGVSPIQVAGEFITRNALPAAVSMMLLGLLTMLIRKKALSQIVGIVAIENGLYLMAVVATNGLPLAVELGVAVDLAVGVLVMGVVARQIHRTFDTINTDRLQTLKG
ncbi:MAG: NADH-quinone oxidoreductase subunit K [Chloroflexota bacterium]